MFPKQQQKSLLEMHEAEPHQSGDTLCNNQLRS